MLYVFIFIFLHTKTLINIQMATLIQNLVHGKIKIKDEQPNFHGDEILYISIRDSLQHDTECIEF